MSPQDQVYEISRQSDQVLVKPKYLVVKPETKIRWILQDANPESRARVVFMSPIPIDFGVQTTMSVGEPMEGTAKVPGIHYHAVQLWEPKKNPTVAMAIIIIEDP